jgi:colanic acid biosynthesis glycosyl transferase WcaI
MHILVVCQFWPPEMGAPASRFYDFGRHWTACGHRVSVVTAFPNFPSGVIPPAYRGKAYQHEVMDGINVYRTYIFASPKLSKLSKGLGYLTFVVSASLFILLTRLRYDAVIATSPPPVMGLPGLLASFKRGVPLVFDVRDIWPEAIVLSGRIRNRLLIRLLEGVESLLYRVASVVSVVTEGKRRRLIERGVPQSKLAVLWNGVDLGLFDRESEGTLPPAFESLDPNARWLTYADRLRRQRPDLYAQSQFVLIGGGSELQRLQARRNELSLDRVAFLPIQPRSVIYRALRRSFAILITLRPRRDEHTVPSKVFESLASARPILLSAAGEAASIIESCGGGRVTRPGDADELCREVVALLDDPTAADEMGRRGRRYVADHFDRRKTAAQLPTELNRAMPKRAR